MKRWRSIIYEPLFVFVIVGGLLFFADHTLSNNKKPEFVVSGAARAAVLDQQKNLKGGDISIEEGELAINQFIDEEILLKEAYRLGLDKDPIIRTRLLRKVRFLLSAEQREPTEGELQRYYASHLDQYTQPNTISFDQLFFSLENHPANNMLERLKAGEDPSQFGNSHSRFPRRMKDETLEAIMARFGNNVSDAISNVKKGFWVGPLISPQGEHFIRVLSVQKGRVSSYQRVKKYVKNGWKKTEKNKTNAIKIRALRNQYSIRVGGVNK
jgi:peptidyl-prolyl cis-trans isomerase C